MPNNPASRVGDKGARTGTQSIERAVMILRIIAGGANSGGLRLADIVSESGLDTSTAHRMLKSLSAAGLVERADAGWNYRLGHLVYELGLAALPRNDLQAICEDSLIRIAEESGDVALLAIRSGVDSVCMGRREGSFPILSLSVNVGTRRPLGIGAGGLAILASLPPELAKQIVETNSLRLKQFNTLTAPALMRMVQDTRDAGYALNRGEVYPEVGGIGVAIRGAGMVPLASLSISTVASRLQPERIQSLVKLLRAEVKSVEAKLSLSA